MWYAFPVVGISATNLRRLVNPAGTADGTAAPNSDGEKFDYIYNPWGQLVEIKKYGGGSVTNAKYTYSAMGHRISEQLDTNDSSNSGVGDGLVDAYDPKFFIATDPSGRRLATYRGTDYDPKETFIHHDARVRGPVHQGGPILRDRDADLADKPFYWASEPAASDRYERHYYALDYRGYVSAIFAGDGTLVEQVRYSATGVPFNIPLGDVEGNGKVESTGVGNPDYDQIEYMWKTPAYHVRGDLDLDGDVDAADLAIAQARDGTGTGRGYVSTSSNAHSNQTTESTWAGPMLALRIQVAALNVLFIRADVVLTGARSAIWVPMDLDGRYFPLPPRTFRPNCTGGVQGEGGTLCDAICTTACNEDGLRPSMTVCYGGQAITCDCLVNRTSGTDEGPCGVLHDIASCVARFEGDLLTTVDCANNPADNLDHAPPDANVPEMVLCVQAARAFAVYSCLLRQECAPSCGARDACNVTLNAERLRWLDQYVALQKSCDVFNPPMAAK